VAPEFVRILGNTVQVIALGERRHDIGALLESMRREGLVTGSVREIPPGVEDSFVTLMRD